jgi:hypothetical protein
MPVLLYGSVEDLDLLLPLATTLRSDGGEVRCYLDDDAYELRNLGCKLAVGRLDDESNLEGALAGVHTFIPFLPDPARIEDEQQVDWLIRLGIAAAAGGATSAIQQTILAMPSMSSVDNPLTGAYSVIRDEFVNNFRPLCIFSTGLTWGAGRPFTHVVANIEDARALEAQVSVVRDEDLVRLLAVADDRENLQGTWEFATAPIPLARLKKEAARQPTNRVASTWLLEMLENGFVVGASAAQEFGVVAEFPF